MIDKPQIVHTAAQHTAIIHIIVPRGEIQGVMGPGLSELMAAVAAQGVSPTGPCFDHHQRMDPDTFDFEIGVPVQSPISPAGRVQPGRLPATTVARTIYHGGYEGLGAAGGELDAWITGQGLTPSPDLWECFVGGVESDPDPATFRTELHRPLSDLGV